MAGQQSPEDSLQIIRLMTRLNGIAIIAWQGGEALTKIGGAGLGVGYLASGIGFGVWLVSAILWVWIVIFARQRWKLDVLGDAIARKVFIRTGRVVLPVLITCVVIGSAVTVFTAISADLVLNISLAAVVGTALLVAAAQDRQLRGEAQP
ncbi:MAG: hypothetical protein JJU26_12015 [Oceanicaulis sp.]|uniref:hypothetical protein n=1 Tax=Glycocaulis sp. TaxID=1969725 RepID=UPI0025BC8936|nr:hypothetical protein [Glycocaulis sp.]MCC5982430.1 hypothetical protein [Oceanicaulis sp.]MCH8521265.1 hypothetical protein [Glycocaulis sp.]